MEVVHLSCGTQAGGEPKIKCRDTIKLHRFNVSERVSPCNEYDIVLTRLAIVTLSWGEILPAATSLSPSFTFSMAACGRKDKMVSEVMCSTSFSTSSKTLKAMKTSSESINETNKHVCNYSSCTLWTPMVSGKHPRRPLYSLLVSMTKWRSFLGCKREQRSTDGGKKDKGKKNVT